MALVTLQRSPTPSAASSASTSELEAGSDEERKLNVRNANCQLCREFVNKTTRETVLKDKGAG